jgi:Polyketide cyclase / dehydrase and lipid transport
VATFRTTIATTLPADEAFRRMAAFERAAEWDETIVEARRVSDDELGIGTRFYLVTRFAGRNVPLAYEMIAWEPPLSFTVEARNSSFSARDTISVETSDSGSTVSYDARLAFTGLRRLLEPVMRILFTHIGRKAEGGLRRYLA